jgi:hypothetical protein
MARSDATGHFILDGVVPGAAISAQRNQKTRRRARIARSPRDRRKLPVATIPWRCALDPWLGRRSRVDRRQITMLILKPDSTSLHQMTIS